MARKSKQKKDRTSLVISVALHVIIIGGFAYWAYKSGKWEQIRQAVLQYVRPEKKEQKKEEPLQQKAAPSKLPPINQGLPPAAGSGTRRAVASEAPAAAGESFFQDTRRQVQGPGGGGAAAALPPKPPPPVLRGPALAPPSTFTKETRPSTIASVLEGRQKAAAAQDTLSKEQIAKSGSSDAAAVVSKITGASVVEGKYVVVRGLSDRYNTTMLNGGEVPTADPYRKAAQLDLFPSAMIDRIVVNKTFTPDQPGGWAGGAVNIITRSFPDQFFFNFSLGTEYNSLATFNDKFLTYTGGKTDWLGFDDGTRALPKQLAKFKSPDDIPQPPGPGAPLAEAEAYRDLLRSFKSTQMGPVQSAPPLNQSLALAFGDTFRFLERRVGVIGSFSYENKYAMLDGVSGRFVPETTVTPVVPATNRFYTNDVTCLNPVVWGAAANVAYELSEDHILNFNYFYTQNGISYVRQRVGVVKPEQLNGAEDSQGYQNTLDYIERQLHGFQFRGQHQLPQVRDLQVDWLTSFANTSQDEPDLRIFNFLGFGDGTIDFGGSSGLPEPGYPTRYYRSLNEDNQTYRMDFTLPLEDNGGLPADLKFGGYYNHSQRQFQEQTFSFRRINRPPETGDPFEYPNTFLNPTNTDFTAVTNRRTRQVSYVFNRQLFSDLGNSSYNGEQDIYAGYIMPDFQVTPWLRFVGGVRYEPTYLVVHSTARNLGTNIFTSLIDEQDWLPAAGLNWTVSQDMNLRLSYSETLARPTYREFASYRTYDVVADEVLQGNTNLVISHVQNYDVRWEWFPRAGEVLALSGFYKNITDPIEKTSLDRAGEIVTYTNFPEATVYGVEFEARTSLDVISPALSWFSVGVNFAWIHSLVDNPPNIAAEKQAATGLDSETRPLYDQSPYVLNADLSYDNPRSGTRASAVFSQSGERLYLVNPTGYDVYEQPAPLLDFIIAQDLGRHLTLRFTAKNLLDPQFQTIYGQKGQLNGDFPYYSFRKGRTFGLSLTYIF